MLTLTVTLSLTTTCRFFDKNERAQKNPLQLLVEEHKLKIKVDEKIEQAYSNGWLKHSAWFFNGDGNPKMAKTNYEYKGGKQDSPRRVADFLQCG